MWLYRKEGKLVEFTEDMIPEGAVGFTYSMLLELDGKKKYYLGKKNFYADVKTALGKKEMSARTDARTKIYKRIRRTAYKNYYSSNEIIKQAKKDGIPIERTIIKICFSKSELTYEETKLLFFTKVLESDDFLNDNILGKFFRTKTKKDE